MLPGEAVTMNDVIGDPLEFGTLKLTLTTVLPAATEAIKGAKGTSAGTTASDTADAAPVPALLDADTTNV
jgi:hypothetical protein